MSINRGLLSSETGEWETPQHVFDALDAEFGFTLDPCASESNAKCERFYTRDDNGLAQSWEGEVVFVNPPYGRQIGRWAEKAYLSARGTRATVVMLVPSRTDTKWWHRWIMQANEIRLIRGRLRFGGARKSAPFPSAIVVFLASHSDLVVTSYDRSDGDCQADLSHHGDAEGQ